MRSVRWHGDRQYRDVMEGMFEFLVRGSFIKLFRHSEGLPELAALDNKQSKHCNYIPIAITVREALLPMHWYWIGFADCDQ